MKSFKKILAAFVVALVPWFSGCASNSTVELTAEDYQAAALSCLEKLYQDGVLDRLEESPTIKVTRVLNRTSCNVQTDWITSIIISDLNRQGKVRALTEDTYMREKAEWERIMSGKCELGESSVFADITLSGKIYEDHHRAGRGVRKTYMFRLELNMGDIVIGGPYLHTIKKASLF
ncbi:MAG: hypothetical protein ACI4QA_04235 [Candidatus Spyradosoma sp.]